MGTAGDRGVVGCHTGQVVLRPAADRKIHVCALATVPQMHRNIGVACFQLLSHCHHPKCILHHVDMRGSPRQDVPLSFCSCCRRLTTAFCCQLQTLHLFHAVMEKHCADVYHDSHLLVPLQACLGTHAISKSPVAPPHRYSCTPTAIKSRTTDATPWTRTRCSHACAATCTQQVHTSATLILIMIFLTDNVCFRNVSFLLLLLVRKI